MDLSNHPDISTVWASWALFRVKKSQVLRWREATCKQENRFNQPAAPGGQWQAFRTGGVN